MHNEAHGQDLGAHLHRVDAREHRLQFLLIIRIDNGYLGLDDDGNCEDFEMDIAARGEKVKGRNFIIVNCKGRAKACATDDGVGYEFFLSIFYVKMEMWPHARTRRYSSVGPYSFTNACILGMMALS